MFFTNKLLSPREYGRGSLGTQDQAQARFGHVKSLCCERQKRNADQQIPQMQRAGSYMTALLGAYLTKESLLIPVADTFHLTMGIACSLNLHSHGGISRKLW